VAVDRPQAFRWYQMAALGGSPLAITNLGICYYNGEGVAVNHAAAARYFLMAARLGRARAQFMLGRCYEKGEGVSADAREAAFWYEKAADQGLKEAQYCLALSLERGLGVQMDRVRSMDLLQRSAEQGFTAAQLLLGVRYFNGEDGPRNNSLAYGWTLLASAAGDERASGLVQYFIVNMSAEDRAIGRDFASRFRPKAAQVAEREAAEEARRSMMLFDPGA
jgi:TPR repeat protein